MNAENEPGFTVPEELKKEGPVAFSRHQSLYNAAAADTSDEDVDPE